MFYLDKEVITIRFYYENYCGDSGYFTMRKNDIPRAIMSAWNIEAELYIVMERIDKYREECKLIFSPNEDNEINNGWLKEYGLYIKDGEEYRELHYIKDDSLAWQPNKYDGILELC